MGEVDIGQPVMENEFKEVKEQAKEGAMKERRRRRTRRRRGRSWSWRKCQKRNHG